MDSCSKQPGLPEFFAQSASGAERYKAELEKLWDLIQTNETFVHIRDIPDLKSILEKQGTVLSFLMSYQEYPADLVLSDQVMGFAAGHDDNNTIHQVYGFFQLLGEEERAQFPYWERAFSWYRSLWCRLVAQKKSRTKIAHLFQSPEGDGASAE